MKVIIFSDSHRNTEPMIAATAMEKPDVIIHLGDHESDAVVLAREYPAIPMYAVAGNCDFASAAPRRIITEIGGFRFFLTHGHDYGVKFGLEKVINTAMAAGTDVLLFGHTHKEISGEREGLTVINPGSVGNGHCPYGIIVIKDKKLDYEQKYFA